MLTPYDILGPDGSIARRLERYELRQEQLDMAEAVHRAFIAKRHLAVEAGTGVGKSFAYLVPAILQTAGDQNNAGTILEQPKPNDSEPDEEDPFYGEKPPRSRDSNRFEGNYSDLNHSDLNRLDPNRELQQIAERGIPDESAFIPRVVISTHTISLQEQIIEKDIPFLRSVLPFEFTAVLVKGRGNYLCLRRLHTVQQKQGLLFDDRKLQELQRIVDWSKETEEGSRSSLNPEPDWSIWGEICCEAGNCLGKKCSYFASCFYAQARRRIANAQILVVNHALLFSDLSVRMQGGSILPVYHFLVFDEAHTMEQVAANHLGFSVTQGQIEYNLNRLYNPRTQRGLLTDQSLGEKIVKSLIVVLQQAVDECFYASENFFQDLETWLQRHPGSNGRIRKSRIVNNSLSGSIRKLNEKLRELLEQLKNPNERQELRSARERMAALAGNIDVWVLQGLEEESVYWLEATHSGRGKPRISVNAVPIDIGPILREQLFAKIPSIVMTSATLSTGK
ncbi:MAG: hypothetical protein LBL62_11785 [Planctomycetaceae bacterium]|jgi:ATP-dependent DNA helicase DinG|nr:hypothetical protein [Planctomycetaceae bacterium]